MHNIKNTQHLGTWLACYSTVKTNGNQVVTMVAEELKDSGCECNCVRQIERKLAQIILQ